MNDKDRGTTAANARGPSAEPCETGLSSNVQSELHKINPSIAARIREHIERKNG